MKYNDDIMEKLYETASNIVDILDMCRENRLDKEEIMDYLNQLSCEEMMRRL